MITRTPRPGVLRNTFSAPYRQSLVAAPNLPVAWSMIEDTPIVLGGNDIHGDCLTDMAFNAGFVTAMRSGIILPVDNAAPFSLYCQLGGMPADIGLDPAVLLNYWQQNPINGYLLKSIEALALDDVIGMKQAMIDTGFILCTATLDQAQITQKEWLTVPGSPVDGGHAFLGTGYIADRATDATWGEECSFDWQFLKAQGQNVWRAELVAA